MDDGGYKYTYGVDEYVLYTKLVPKLDKDTTSLTLCTMVSAKSFTDTKDPDLLLIWPEIKKGK